MSTRNLTGGIMKKLILLLLIPVILFTGCIYQPEYYPEEDLVVYTVRNAMLYEYQEKVAVKFKFSGGSGGDSLLLRTDANADSWMSLDFYYETILYGHFEKVGWYDDVLFILMEETYYAIDIDEYEVPPLDEDGNTSTPTYDLKEYSISEFTELYPNYESFDWYGH